MKARTFFSLLVGLFLLNSCETTSKVGITNDPVQTLAAPADKALVYIMRPSVYGFAFSFSVSCKNIDLGDMYSKRFTYLFAEPNTYKFLAKGENKDELILSLEAGKTYFLETRAEMGLLSPRAKWQKLTEPEGRKKLSKCSLPKGFVTPAFITASMAGK